MRRHLEAAATEETGALADARAACAARYSSTLCDYLVRRGEAALHGAYELGRKAMLDGLGCVEMAAIHRESLAIILSDRRPAGEVDRVVEQAGRFLAEALSPFEMALRGIRETNVQLTRNISELLAAEAQLREQRDRLLAAETELRSQRDELLAAHQALEAEQRRYRDLFDSAPDGYLVTDLGGAIVEANRAAEALLGVATGALAGTRLAGWVAQDSRAAFESRMRELLDCRCGEAVKEWQFDMRPRSGPCFPVTLGVGAVKNAEGLPVSLRLLLRDVTERKRIEEERAQLLVREQVARAQGEAARRFAFLAEVSALLVASFDCETSLSGVANLAVPFLANACLICLTDDENRLRLASGAYDDPGRAARASRLHRGPAALDAGSRFAIALETGRTEILSPEPGDALSQASAAGPPAFRFLLEENLASFMLVPMRSHSRVLGLIVLAAVEAEYYNHDHAAFAEDLASRCALAVENARLYRGMAAERDRAAEANRAKDEFLGLLGHELRNPLVPILGWARNLNRNSVVTGDDALSRGVGAIERNALNILRLADDCLDLARISERKVALECEPLDLNGIIRYLIEGLKPMAQEKDLEITARLPSGELRVMGDRTRLEQVMSNLLVNAIKYTAGGGAISVGAVATGDIVEIEMKDTGIGIAPEFLEQVFQPLRRGGREFTTTDASLGLGLAIARKIVELHGGAIWAESPGIGGGSTFHVKLPAAPANQSESGPGLRIGQEHAKARSIRVLLIDDHKDTRDLMKMELEDLGYDVLAAPDGEAGLEAAIRCVPEIIISDLKLPKISGYELIRRLRRLPGLSSVPAIALTGLVLKKDMEAALTAGFDACLNKPADVNELSEMMQKLSARP